MKETAVRPQKIILCLLSRHENEETVVEEVGEAEVVQAILRNSLYVDQPQVWQENVANLKRMLVGETAVTLKLGSDRRSLIQAMIQLFA